MKVNTSEKGKKHKIPHRASRYSRNPYCITFSFVFFQWTTGINIHVAAQQNFKLGLIQHQSYFGRFIPNCGQCPSGCHAFKVLAWNEMAAISFSARQIGWYFKTTHIYLRLWEELGMKLAHGPLLYSKLNPMAVFLSGGTLSKECSLIWDGEEASGREKRAKGNKPNTAFVVPKNKTQSLEKQARAGCKPLGFLTRVWGVEHWQCARC